MSKKIINVIALILVAFSLFAEEYGLIDSFSWAKSVTYSIGYGIIAFKIGAFIRKRINEENKGGFILELVKVYTIIQLLYMIVTKKIMGHDFFTMLLSPVGINIFLIAFAIYIIVLPIISKYKNPILISIALAIIGISTSNISMIGLTKVLALLPYAIIGYCLDEDFIKRMFKLKKVKIPLILISFLTFGFIVFLCYNHKNIEPYIYLNNFSMNNMETYLAIIHKIIMYVYSFSTIGMIYMLFSSNKIKNGKLNLKAVILIMSIIQILIIASHNLLYNEYIARTMYIPIFVLASIAVTIVTILFSKLRILNIPKTKQVEKEKALKIKNKITIKSIIEYIVHSPLIVVGFYIIILLKTVFLYRFTYGFEYGINEQLILNIGVISIILLPLIFIKKAWTRFFLCVLVDLIISIVFLSDVIYYAYSDCLMSLSQLGNSKYSKEIVNALPDLIKPKYIIYLIDFVVLLPMLLMVKNKKTKYIDRVILAICAMAILVVNANNVSSAYSFSRDIIYDKKMQVQYGTIFTYHISDIRYTLKIKDRIVYNSEAQVKDIINNFKGVEETKIKKDLDNIAKGKNTIIVQLESIQNFVVNRKINGEEITPNLNKFINENINITNMHQQSYTTTADSEFGFTTGLFPLESGLSYEKYYGSEYPDLYGKLNDAGYTTALVHGNRSNFWNRSAVYSNFGVQKPKYMADFEHEESDKVYGMLSDVFIYDKTVEDMKTYKEPFLQTLIMASSHNPFKTNECKDQEEFLLNDLGKYKDTLFGDYLNSCRYMDYAFGKFIEDLKEENMYDDSLIVVFGDHRALPKDMPELIEYMNDDAKRALTDVELQHTFTNVLAGIKVPGGSDPIKVEHLVSKIDIKPTILDMLGIEDTISVGKNLFNDEGYIGLNNGIVYAEDYYYYDSNWVELKTGIIIDRATLSTEKQEELQRYIDELKKKIDISFSIGIGNILEAK